MNRIEEIQKGFEYTKSVLNSLTISGVENCKKIGIIYNNIEAFLLMIANGEVTIAESDKEKEDNKEKKKDDK